MIELAGVDLVYSNGVQALTDINWFVARGEFVFLVGPTGSGKSSLIRLIHRDAVPTAGSIFVDDHDLLEIKRSRIPFLRRRIGVIFQDYQLLSNRTVYENVAYALEVTGHPRAQIPNKALTTLEMVGLVEKADAFPAQLSGGEQQRTVIARALVHHPHILLADEPTGHLDPDSGWEIMQILTRVNAQGATVVVATHNKTFVDAMRRRVVALAGGRIVADQPQGVYHPEPAALPMGEPRPTS